MAFLRLLQLLGDFGVQFLGKWHNYASPHLCHELSFLAQATTDPNCFKLKSGGHPKSSGFTDQ